MSISLETELAGTEAAPQHQPACGCHNQQRNHLLPIHALNITSNGARAIGDLTIPDRDVDPRRAKSGDLLGARI
jgi:hypothetical protein